MYLTTSSKTDPKDKKCKECKEMFTPKKSLQSYCGYKCSNTSANRRRMKRVTVSCRNCKVSFEKRPSDLKSYNYPMNGDRYKYCSRECWKEGSQSSMTVPRLKIKAWTQFSKYIRDRDNWTCITCGKVEKGRQMHAGHFISRRYNNTLFDEMNVHAQCSSCNMFRGGELHIYSQIIISRYGFDEYEKLLERGKTVKKFTKQELIDIYQKYKT